MDSSRLQTALLHLCSENDKQSAVSARLQLHIYVRKLRRPNENAIIFFLFFQIACKFASKA